MCSIKAQVVAQALHVFHHLLCPCGYCVVLCCAVLHIQIVGDDLLCTNPKRIQRAINEKSCNALLLKVNQIGTVTESIKAVQLAKSAGWGVLTSHRSGETADDFIADIAVGLSTGHIKSGAPAR